MDANKMKNINEVMNKRFADRHPEDGALPGHCDAPLCERCLLDICKDDTCAIHIHERKMERRWLAYLLFGGRIGYQYNKVEQDLLEKLMSKYYEEINLELSDGEKEIIGWWSDRLGRVYNAEK